MYNIDFTPLLIFMWIGVIATAIAVFVGIPYLAYYLWTHLQWVQP